MLKCAFMFIAGFIGYQTSFISGIHDVDNQVLQIILFTSKICTEYINCITMCFSHWKNNKLCLVIYIFTFYSFLKFSQSLIYQKFYLCVTAGRIRKLIQVQQNHI